MTDGGSVRLSLTCDDEGEERACAIVFGKMRALRSRAETYCSSWHIEGVYDTVCEIEGSEWVAQLRSESVPEWRDAWVMRHFMIFVDSYGCLEVVAADASLEEDKNSDGT